MTFDSCKTVNNIKVIWYWPLTLWPNIDMDLLFNIGNHPMRFDHCDPDLWPYDPKINRDHVLDLAVHPIKFWGWLILKLLRGNCF
jgi:hypothetical protein